MEIEADPTRLQQDADRLTALAGDLLAAAHRLGGLLAEDRPPGSARVAERCARLELGLRAEAAALLECADLLRAERVGLLLGEAEAVLALRCVRRPAELPVWAR
ncbi:MAG: hypothetical protein ACT4O0_03855 [Pseudonocardia sp.]